MTDELEKAICEVRLLVGFLGEKQQFNWWESAFLSPVSKSFLTPVFPKTTLRSQYNGVCQASSLVHDSFIGTGFHYHLYRLPDSIERMACMAADNSMDAITAVHLSSVATAMARLEQFCVVPTPRCEGPIVVGDYNDRKLDSLLRKMASHYCQAFTGGYKCYPYMRHG
jgi:hypothetical protein